MSPEVKHHSKTKIMQINNEKFLNWAMHSKIKKIIPFFSLQYIFEEIYT